MTARALLALVALLFVAAPMADAIACGPEMVAAGDVHAAAPDDAGDQGPEQSEHAACQHGHCHHGYAGFGRGGSGASTWRAEAAPPSPATNLVLPSWDADGLKRPPRA